MPRSIIGVALSSLALTCAVTRTFAQAPLDTSFTYQGQLKQAGGTVTGTADFQFTLFDALDGETQIGAMLSVNNVDVVEGLFTVSLDFGAAAFNGDALFLEMAVRSPAGGGAFTTLEPRQALHATPYALKTRGVDGHSLNAADGSPADAVFVDSAGSVGIGTNTPLTKLHVHEGDLFMGLQTNGWFYHNRVPFNGDFMHITDTVNGVPQFQRGLALTKAGTVGIGTTAPLAKLHVHEGDLYMGLRTNGWFFHTRSPFNGDFMHITDTVNGVPQFQRGLVLTKAGRVGIGITSPQASLHVNGTARCNVLQITGADIAEKFPMTGKAEPGMVVAIDPDHPGRLCLARGAYNTCVAGVVSGANDFSAGAVLGNLPGLDDAPAVALSGRVYVHCDAGQAAIAPGDLLTTSGRPGYAMKVTDARRAAGAIIGKAMEPLPQGSGLILVLVNLQ